MSSTDTRADLRFDETVEPLARPTTPEVDAILGVPIRLLDHGFVRLVDYMGNDAAIVQAARVSYGKGTKKRSEDAGLIRYLMRHRHTSPFEMVDTKFHIKAPIFVARQWLRHRTACLAGDSVLSFDLPGAADRGGRQHHGMTIEKFYRMWHEGTAHPIAKKKPLFLERVDRASRYSIPELARLVQRREETLRNLVRAGDLKAERVKGHDPREPAIFVYGHEWHNYALKTCEATVSMRGRLGKMHLRMCDEVSGEIKHTQITDIWQSGIKQVFKVTLANGKTLKMTRDHRCLTERGWMTLHQATGIRLNDKGGVSWNEGAPAFATNGVPAYQSAEWLGEQRRAGLGIGSIADEAGVSYHTIRKWLRVHGLSFTAKERAQLSGRSQRGQRRTYAQRRVFGESELAAIREARSGPNSNFWKGGITSERASIARWTADHAHRTHERNSFRCVICLARQDLQAHHIDPVWHNASRAGDEMNLTSLCQPCHSQLHALNLELAFLSAVEARQPLAEFWTPYPSAQKRPAEKRLPTTTRLFRQWSKVTRIEYAGEEMTYDLSVAGPYHNFVANGFIVHNSVNEVSARYSLLPEELYIPEDAQISFQSTDNKQGRSTTEVPPEVKTRVRELLMAGQRESYASYQELIDAEIARELARIALPVSIYTEWYWKLNLHNLFHFLSLRMDAHAQYEIRIYAEAIGLIVQRIAPVAYQAFLDYMRESTSLSGPERTIVTKSLHGEPITPEDWTRISKRERTEFARKFGLDIPELPPATPKSIAMNGNGHGG